MKKEKDSHPDFIVLHGQTGVGVAWHREDDRGHYVSVVFEKPSLYRKPFNGKGRKSLPRGAESRRSLTLSKPIL
jgi:uncharacterized protein (DUF736 family)